MHMSHAESLPVASSFNTPTISDVQQGAQQLSIQSRLNVDRKPTGSQHNWRIQEQRTEGLLRSLTLTVREPVSERHIQQAHAWLNHEAGSEGLPPTAELGLPRTRRPGSSSAAFGGSQLGNSGAPRQQPERC